MKYICTNCGKQFKKKSEFAFSKCPECGGDSWWKGSSKFKGITTRIHRPMPVAYFKDEKTGTMIPVDKRGNKVDYDPYYKGKDPRGWKRAGKGTKGYERSIYFRNWKPQRKEK